MAIKSHAFGRVTLTGEDATKFKKQVAYGRPTKAAIETAKRGAVMAREMRDNGGKLTFKVTK
jgi:hypothetical protein